MNLPLPLIISIVFLILLLIIFPLFVSFKDEKQQHKSEWEKIKEYGNKINNKTRKNK